MLEKAMANLKIDKVLFKSFYHALKIKGFVILAGLSGTGKTKIFEEFVKLFPNIQEEGEIIKNSFFLPIRPDFKDSASLLGYYNPLKEQYESTGLLEFILNATKNFKQKKREAHPFFLLFDEMNLARVEYYFADFLSILESSKTEEGFTEQGIILHNEDPKKLGVPQKLFLPPNLYFIGTVNMDETTHSFSPKVLDRAFTLEFDVGEIAEYLKFLTKEKEEENQKSIEFKEDLKAAFTHNGTFIPNRSAKKEVDSFLQIKEHHFYLEILNTIQEILRPYQLHFGYRVVDEILLFLNSVYEDKKLKEISQKPWAFLTLQQALDFAIKTKILPKFYGNRRKLEKPLIDLLTKWLKIENPLKNIEQGIPKTLKSNYPYTEKKLLEMLFQLQNSGFAGFM